MNSLYLSECAEGGEGRDERGGPGRHRVNKSGGRIWESQEPRVRRVAKIDRREALSTEG